MNKIITFFTVSICLLFITKISVGQAEFINTLPNAMGSTGLIMTPTARTAGDQEITLSINRLPKEYAFVSRDQYLDDIYSITLNYLPFLEVTGSLLRNEKTPKSTIGSKSFKLRAKLLSERKLLPALMIGAHDVYKYHTEGAGAIYAVTSKHIKGTFDLDLDLSFGYAVDLQKNKVWGKSEKLKEYETYLNGFFGGVAFNYKNYLSFMLEYDTEKVNVGVGVLFSNSLSCQIRLLNAESISFGIAYTFAPNKILQKRQKEDNIYNEEFSTKVDDWLISLTNRNNQNPNLNDTVIAEQIKDLKDLLAKIKKEKIIQEDSLNVEDLAITDSTATDSTLNAENLNIEGNIQNIENNIIAGGGSSTDLTKIQRQVDGLQLEQDELNKHVKFLEERITDLEGKYSTLKKDVDKFNFSGDYIVGINKAGKSLNILQKGYYYVVVSSSKIKANALKESGRLAYMGIDSYVAYNKTRDWYYIYTRRFSTKEQALKRKNELKSRSYPDAWIFRY